MAETAVAESEATVTPQELARRHGLHAAAARPSLPAYTRQLWSYRHFIGSYASAKVATSFGKTRLGRLWQVLTPLTNAAVYYLIFDVILNAGRDVDNFIAYLCTGVFLFSFTQSVVQAGTQAVTGNLGLIRALHFPRASLPIALTLVEAQHLVASMSVLAIIVLVTGEPLTWQWLLMPVILLLQGLFNAGLAMGVARLGSKVTDLKQLVPFIMRFWLYGSAVLYPVQRLTDDLHGWKLHLVEANPMLVFIELMRHALMEDVQLAGPPLRLWLVALAWTVIVGLGGYIYFWRGEKEYGRG